MHPHIIPLTRVEEVDSVLARSAETPVLLFKHSYSCGTSAEALDELVAHLDDDGHHVPTFMVTVQTHRDVSNAVAARLGIRHETPQALLIRDGRIVWSASHFRVNAKALHDAVESLSIAA